MNDSVDLGPTLNARDLYKIPEETPSETERGHVNPSYNYSLNDSFSSLPSFGQLTPALSHTSVNSVSSRCVIKSPDGSTLFITPEREDRKIPSRPLKEKHVKMLKAFGIAAIFLFPPTGVAAYMYAILTSREFQAAQQTGDLVKAKQKAKICERLVILSLVLGIIMYALIFGLIGRSISSGSGESMVKGTP